MNDLDSNILIEKIRIFPSQLKEIVPKLSNEILNTPIREGAWTIRQSINHLVDSHVNSYIRIKLALTEPEVTFKPYNEKLWAELPDVKGMDIDQSVQIIEGLHARAVVLLENMNEDEWNKNITHPEIGNISLKSYIKIFADHGEKHLNSVKKTIEKMIN